MSERHNAKRLFEHAGPRDMKRNISFSMIIAAVACLGIGVNAAAEESGNAESALKCPVSGRAANPEVTVDYRGGEIALCCAGCAKPFEENTEKYATKANLQLVRSGQAEQVGCPISGRDVNPDQTLAVGGVDVGFCCGGCKAKVAKADDPVAAVFGDGFDKAYEVKSEDGDEG